MILQKGILANRLAEVKCHWEIHSLLCLRVDNGATAVTAACMWKYGHVS